MNRQQLDHLIAAAANAINEDEFVVVGSQAVLGTVPVAPASMLISMEADLYPLREPDRAVEVDGALGEGSPFQRAFGYYAHGVGPETAKLPRDWEERRVRVEIDARIGSKRQPVAYCPDINDLALSKLAADRVRDIDFARETKAHGLIDLDAMRERVADLPVNNASQQRIVGFINSL